MRNKRAASDPSVRVTLTARQEDVLRLMAEGATNGQIAERLGLSLEGAKWHIREIFGRLGVDSREEAVAAWKNERRRQNPFAWLAPLPLVGGAAIAVVTTAVVAVFAFSRSADAPDAVPDAAETTAIGTATPVVYLDAKAPVIASTPLRAQPPLKEVARGDKWRLLMADDGLGVPNASDMVLAVGYETQPGRVDVLDRDGRVAARIEAGYAVMARVRPTTGEVLVSDWVGEPAAETWHARILLFDLRSRSLRAEIPLAQQRINFTIPGNALYASTSGRWLYWVEHATVCPSGGDEAVCDQMIVRAVDLERMEPAKLDAKLTIGCGVPAVSIDGASGIIAKCLPRSSSNRYQIDAESVEPMTLISPGAPPRGWLATHANGLSLEPSFRDDSSALEETSVIELATGAELARWDIDGAWDAMLLADGSALVLLPSGRLERFNVASGAGFELPYAIEAGPFVFDVRLYR